MFVLSRQVLESVVVGGAGGFERLLKVKVLAISADQVRLGFEVDPGVTLRRDEACEQIRAAAGETC